MISAGSYTTKPHMIKLRNSEYEVHQKHLINMLGTTGTFTEMKDPIIRRKEKYLEFGRNVYSMLVLSQKTRLRKKTKG